MAIASAANGVAERRARDALAQGERRPHRDRVDGDADRRRDGARDVARAPLGRRRHRAQAPGRGDPGLAHAHHRGGRRGAPRARAQPPRRRPAAARRALGLAQARRVAHDDRPGRRRLRSSTPRARSSRPRSRSSASSRAGSIRPCSPTVGSRRPSRRSSSARRSRSTVEMPPERLPAPIEAAAYYVISEAITNIVKYAGATSITVAVVRDEKSVIVTVIDDGCGGADPDRRHRPARAPRPGRGARRRAHGRQPDRPRHEDRRRDPARGTPGARPLESSRLARDEHCRRHGRLPPLRHRGLDAARPRGGRRLRDDPEQRPPHHPGRRRRAGTAP